MQIYLARNNQQAGPYTLEQLNQMLTSQQVLLTDLVWHEGMTEWKALGELTQGKLAYEPLGYTAPAPFHGRKTRAQSSGFCPRIRIFRLSNRGGCIRTRPSARGSLWRCSFARGRGNSPR